MFTWGLHGVVAGFTPGMWSFIGVREGGVVAAVRRFFYGLSLDLY